MNLKTELIDTSTLHHVLVPENHIVIDLDLGKEARREVREFVEAKALINPYQFYSDDGGTNWWVVCPECKKITKVVGRYCEHCNAKFPWVKQPWETRYSKKEDGVINE